MPRRVILPQQISGRPFSVVEAIDLGVTRGRLDSRDLIIPFRGVRDVASLDPPAFEHRCRQYAIRMRSWQFFSHETALFLCGVPVPRHPHPLRIHVAAYRPQREPRAVGVIGHRLQIRQPAFLDVSGMRVEHPVRAWRQAGALWGADDLVAAADHIVGRTTLATWEDLASEVAAMGGPATARLRSALPHVRVGAESPEESRLRLVLGRAGLPEPDVNWALYDDRERHIARFDLAFRAYRVAAEYDGRHHELDGLQFARDVDREANVKHLGWELVRVLRHHLAGDGRAAVALVRDALLRAGWRP